MSPNILDRPTPGGIVLDEAMLGGFGGFPDSLFLISVGGDKYACNNVTPLGEGEPINGLACFPDPDEATSYMGLLAGLSGEIVQKSFEEAREIAIGKPVLNAMLLFVATKIVEIHWVR
jgi:hypothetical protein